MARTTLRIDDGLLRRLREKSRREGRTLQDVTNDLLRHGLAREDEAPSYELELEGWDAEEQPGVDLLDRDALFDVMEGH